MRLDVLKPNLGACGSLHWAEIEEEETVVVLHARGYVEVFDPEFLGRSAGCLTPSWRECGGSVYFWRKVQHQHQL